MNNNILKTQKRLFGVIFLGIIFFAVVFTYVFLDDGPTRALPVSKPIDLPGDHFNAQEIWMTRMESENKLLEQKLNYLEEIILDNKKKEVAYDQEKESLKNEIRTLGKQLQAQKDKPTLNPLKERDPFVSGENDSNLQYAKSPLIELQIEEPVRKLSHIDRTIPAGTTVKAVLVSSLDAPCGVYATTDPIPVKLRILDNAHLPKRVRVKLKGGILIGSSYGNLSSERVYMRLERLTLVKPNGDFVETQVAGYVSGEDGKYGVRGTIVDKSRKIVLNAAASGAFSQLGQVLQASVSKNRVQYDNYTLNSDMLKQSAVGGTSNAFDTLADYYLKRAEQILPVIQVTAGRIVDVSFTHGADVGDLHTQDKVRQIRSKNRITAFSVEDADE